MLNLDYFHHTIKIKNERNLGLTTQIAKDDQTSFHDFNLVDELVAIQICI